MRLPIRRRAAAMALLAAPALAQQGRFPNRPIRLVVAFAAGGNSDTMARLIQPHLSAALGQSVVIDNRGGAGGSLAAGQVASAPADGHTLLFDSASFVVAQFLHRNLPFSYERDFAPVGMVAEAPYILAVSAASGLRDLAGFLEAARRQDGMTYGTPGVGSVGHLAGVLLGHRARVRLEHVPYRGGAEVARDLAAGTLPAGILTANSLNPVVQSGRAVPIAVTAGRRGGIAGVPTVAEGGFTGFDVTSWNAVFCRAGTSDAVRAQLAEAIGRATTEPEVRARLTAMGAEARPPEPEALGARVAEERRVLQELIRETGLELG